MERKARKCAQYVVAAAPVEIPPPPPSPTPHPRQMWILLTHYMAKSPWGCNIFKLVKKCTAFCATRSPVTAFLRALHLSAGPSLQPNEFCLHVKIHFLKMHFLFTQTLRSPKWYFLFTFTIRNFVCISVLLHALECNAYVTFFFNIPAIFGEYRKLEPCHYGTFFTPYQRS